MRGNSKKIYIGLRLFNYNDKIQAEMFEKELMKYDGLTTFMPFRDTDENNICGENRTKIIYDSDIQRLASSDISAVAALFDGICKDEGIAFELGYSFGKGLPIYIINTDFIWYSIDGIEFLFDPVLEYMISGYTHSYFIGENESFINALYLGQQECFKEAASRIAKLVEAEQSSLEKYNVLGQEKNVDVSIDFGGERYEYQREYSNQIAKLLVNNGFTVTITNRFSPDNKHELSHRGYEDIKRVCRSNIFLFSGDEMELNSGTAALLGLARCLGRQCIMYESSHIEIHGENGHKMMKNLMIDFSVNKIVKEKDQLLDAVKEVMLYGD